MPIPTTTTKSIDYVHVHQSYQVAPGAVTTISVRSIITTPRPSTTHLHVRSNIFTEELTVTTIFIIATTTTYHAHLRQSYQVAPNATTTTKFNLYQWYTTTANYAATTNVHKMTAQRHPSVHKYSTHSSIPIAIMV